MVSPNATPMTAANWRHWSGVIGRISMSMRPVVLDPPGPHIRFSPATGGPWRPPLASTVPPLARLAAAGRARRSRRGGLGLLGAQAGEGAHPELLVHLLRGRLPGQHRSQP